MSIERKEGQEYVKRKKWNNNRTNDKAIEKEEDCAWNEREDMDLWMEESKRLSYKGLRINNGSGLRLEHRDWHEYEDGTMGKYILYDIME